MGRRGWWIPEELVPVTVEFYVLSCPFFFAFQAESLKKHTTMG